MTSKGKTGGIIIICLTVRNQNCISAQLTYCRCCAVVAGDLLGWTFLTDSNSGLLSSQMCIFTTRIVKLRKNGNISFCENDFWIWVSFMYMPHHTVILNQYDSTSIKSQKNPKNNGGTEIWGFLRQGQDFWRGLYYYISRSYGVQQINPLWTSYVIARPRF